MECIFIQLLFFLSEYKRTKENARNQADKITVEVLVRKNPC